MPIGREHPVVGTSLNNLATLLQATRRTDEAAAAYKPALDIFQAQLQADHPNIEAARDNYIELTSN